MSVLGRAIAVVAVALAVLQPRAALAAAARGGDVYLFLIGMMGLAAYAHIAGIFEWVAAAAVRLAGTSRMRLFALVYGAGIVTTALFSNDATIVVLTPAVIGAIERYDVAPLPYVLACALIANAASFLLPISNPSNLLVFAQRMPPLGAWLAAFALPSLAAIAVTFAILWWWFRRELGGVAATPRPVAARTPAPLAVPSLVLAAMVIVSVSALGGPLGFATFGCAVATTIAAVVNDRTSAVTIARNISWNVIALTAALFVIVSALDAAGGFDVTRAVLRWCDERGTPWSQLATGFVTGLASNALNNLPVGLNLGATLPGLHASARTTQAALIGVNLGPNATLTGSLATLLWLQIVRRANIAITPLGYARIGLIVTLPALTAALLCIHASS